MKRRILPIVLAFLFIINLSALAALAYNQNMGYGRAPARGINRGVARAGAWNARGFGRGMGYNFPRCWRWR